MCVPSYYELSELEIEILLWALGRATHIGGYKAPNFNATELEELIARLERRQVYAR